MEDALRTMHEVLLWYFRCSRLQHGKGDVPESTGQNFITAAFIKLNPHGLAVQGNIVVLLKRFLCAFRFFKLDKCGAVCFATADQSMMWMMLFGSMTLRQEAQSQQCIWQLDQVRHGTL